MRSRSRPTSTTADGWKRICRAITRATGSTPKNISTTEARFLPPSPQFLGARPEVTHTPRVTCRTLGIGLAGFGTVGSGVWNTLQRNGGLITDRTGGVQLAIRKILVRDRAKARATVSDAPAD